MQYLSYSDDKPKAYRSNDILEKPGLWSVYLSGSALSSPATYDPVRDKDCEFSQFSYYLELIYWIGGSSGNPTWASMKPNSHKLNESPIYNLTCETWIDLFD